MPRLTVLAFALLTIGRTGCSQDAKKCATITEQEAVTRAIAAKPDRMRDQSTWKSNEIAKVTLNDSRGWGAMVRFKSDGRQTPTAFIYEDCQVGWAVTSVATALDGAR